MKDLHGITEPSFISFMIKVRNCKESEGEERVIPANFKGELFHQKVVVKKEDSEIDSENIDEIRNNIESKSIEFISEEKYMYTVIALDDNGYDNWIKYVRNIVNDDNEKENFDCRYSSVYLCRTHYRRYFRRAYCCSQ